MNKFLPLIIYFSLSLFSIRLFLFQPGTLGHHWDWTIPPLAYQNCNIAKSIFSEWDEETLGGSVALNRINQPIHLFLHGLGCLGFNGDFISRFLIVFSLTLAAFFMSLLIKELASEKKLGAFFGGLIYAFSPYFYNEIISGASSQMISFAFIPLSVLFFWRNLKNLNLKNVFFASLALVGVSQSLQNFVLTNIIFFFFIFIDGHIKKIWQGIQSWFFILATWVFLSAFWVLPTLLQFKNLPEIESGVTSGNVPAIFHNLQHKTPSFDKAILLLGYWEDFFEKTLVNLEIFNLWMVAAAVLVASSLIITFFWRRRIAILLLAAFLTSLIFATGAKKPLGQFVIWIYKNIPFMGLFKSPQRFLTLPIFFFALLFGLCLNWFWSKFQKVDNRALKTSLGIFLLVTIFIFVFPFLQGDFDQAFDNYRLSPGWKKVSQISGEEKEELFRFFILPSTHSPKYLMNNYQNKNQGFDPNLSHHYHSNLRVDLISTNNLDFFKKILLLLNLHDQQALSMLSFSDVKYIVIRKDVKPDVPLLNIRWSCQKINQFFEKMNLEKVFEDETLTLWKSRDYYPLIYNINEEAKIEEREGDYKPLLVYQELLTLQGKKAFILEIPKFNPRKTYKIVLHSKGSSNGFRVRFNQKDNDQPENFYENCGVPASNVWQEAICQFTPKVFTDKAEIILYIKESFSGESLVRNLQIFEKEDEIQFSSPEAFIPIEFEKIHPWFYKIKFPEVNEQKFLVLSFSHNLGWRLKIDGRNQKPALINQFANGWRIDKNDLKKEVTLVFMPQYYYLGGVLVSLGTLLGLVGVLVIRLLLKHKFQISKLKSQNHISNVKTNGNLSKI